MKNIVPSAVSWCGMFLVSLLLSGCVHIGIEETVSPEGASRVTTTLDMSAMMDMAQGMEEDTEISMEEEDMCEGIREQWETTEGQEEETFLSCTQEKPGKAVIVSEKALGEAFVNQGGKYIYTMDMSPEDIQKMMGEESADAPMDMSNPQQLAMLKNFGVTFSYSVTMPGKILEHSAGELVGENTVKMDLLEVITSETPQVQIIAQGPIDIMMYAMYGGGAIGGLIVILIIIMLLQRKPKKKEEPSDAATTPQKADDQPDTPSPTTDTPSDSGGDSGSN